MSKLLATLMASLFAASVFAADAPAPAAPVDTTAAAPATSTAKPMKHAVAKKKVVKKTRKVKPAA